MKGKEWYEHHFRNCGEGKLKGEFSTSYLYSKEAPERIREMYPETKIIAVLRNPIDRAYSQYRNAIKAGEISEKIPFDSYLHNERSCLEQGLYAEQLNRYLHVFKKEQMLVLVYEDSKKDPASYMRSIFEFLGVDPTFIPSMLHTEINVARTPRLIGVEKVMQNIAEFLRKIGFDSIVWSIKKSRFPELIRSGNTKREKQDVPELDRVTIAQNFKDDVAELCTILGRDMQKEWNI